MLPPGGESEYPLNTFSPYVQNPYSNLARFQSVFTVLFHVILVCQYFVLTTIDIAMTTQSMIELKLTAKFQVMTA